MIHELIDTKKKTNKTSASRNVKTLQENKIIFEDCNFETTDIESKEAESSSTTFIPPWLRNSLGLNQRNNLSHPTTSSDSKSAKIIQKGKEPSQNEFYPLKANVEQDCCKKATDQFEILPQDVPREDSNTKSTDNVKNVDIKSDKDVLVYWDVRRKDSETESNCTNEETKSFVKENPKIIDADIITLAEFEKIKEEEKKRLKLIKHKNKLKKRNTEDQKELDIDKNNIDFLLEMKARETLDNFMKKDVRSVKSEIKNLEEKITVRSPKANLSSNNPKISQQELRLLQEIKNQVGSVEEVEKLFEHVKEINMREFIKNPSLKFKSIAEKKRENKKEKLTQEVLQRGADDVSPQRDKDSLLSTDDENDIKRFSEFLSKNKNLDEKRKCLEEVRNYFEKKRRMRMIKRRFLEEEKSKLSPGPEEKEEYSKEKLKFKDFYRGRRSKFALCNEEVVEKAVDETLQKFVEMYHIHVSPTVMGNMKKNILQAMTSDSLDSENPKTEAASVKKTNLELLNIAGKELEKAEVSILPDAEITEISNKDTTVHKENKKKIFKTLIENSEEQVLKSVKETDVHENEKLQRLRKEFDNFLHSVKNHIDVTNLKIQTIVLEKEELTASSKNVQLVYNFTKKSLEEKTEYWQNLKDSSEIKNDKDSETQTTMENEVIKRNVKVQACEQKSSCEENLQTDEVVLTTQSTQTTDEGINIREIKELTSSDVNPGLYRMVKSKEAGKFYLYPEQGDESKQSASRNSRSSVLQDRKMNKKRELVNVLSRERAKERRVYFREREKAKLKKSKKALNTLPQIKAAQPKKDEDEVAIENSINCLYFRDLDKKNSESVSSKKEVDLTDENISGRLEDDEEVAVSNAKEEISKENHLGCFWFWNGEKITPGCDLKTHVEDLLKEKIKEIANAENHQNDFVINAISLSVDRQEQNRVSEKSLAAGNASNKLCVNSVQSGTKENRSGLAKNECFGEKDEVERKTEDENSVLPMPKKKSMKDVAIQNSQQALLSLNLSKFNIQPKPGNYLKKKCNKRNIVIRPAKGKPINFKKAEDIIRAIEEFRKTKLEFENPKKENSIDSESTLDDSTFTSGSKNEVDNSLSLMLGLKDNPASEEISNLDFKNRLKNLNSFMNREMQAGEKYDLEDVNFTENQTTYKYKHLELIESVLAKASRREREDLWNNITDFIKTKIGRDINDEGAREVCIEIEQEMPKYDQAKAKYAVMAKGHYARNEGEVEVEIDLTLDDLEKILRQRQKKNRRRTLYRSRKSKNFLSSSSVQSDFTQDDLRRYQKYLHKFTVLGGGFAQNKEMKAFLEK